MVCMVLTSPQTIRMSSIAHFRLTAILEYRRSTTAEIARTISGISTAIRTLKLFAPPPVV